MTAIFSGRATGTSRSRDPCRVGSSGLGGLGGAVRQPTRGWPAALAAWLASAQRRSYGWTEVGSNPSMQLGWQCRGCPPGISAERVQFTSSLLLHSTAQHCTGLPPAVSEHPTLTKLMSCTFLHCPAQFQLIINHPLSRPSPATPDCQNNNHQHTTHDTRHTTHATRVHHCCIAASIAISARINRPVPPAGCALGCPPGCPASQKRSEGRRAGIPA